MEMRASRSIYSVFVVLLEVLGSDNGESFGLSSGRETGMTQTPLPHITSTFSTNQGQHVHPDQQSALLPAIERNAHNRVQFQTKRIRGRSESDIDFVVRKHPAPPRSESDAAPVHAGIHLLRNQSGLQYSTVDLVNKTMLRSWCSLARNSAVRINEADFSERKKIRVMWSDRKAVGLLGGRGCWSC